MKQASTLALALLAACATPGGGREAARPRQDLVAISRAMTSIDAADRRGNEILVERQKRTAAADAAPQDPALRFLAVYAQPREGEDRWGGFKELSRDFSDSAFGFVGMAGVYVDWKVLDQVDRVVVLALEAEPDCWLAVRYRAEASERRERYDSAAVDYRAVLQADPKNPEALLGLARVARAQRDAARAKQYAEAALATAPDLFGAHALLADLALEQKDPAEAVARMKRAAGASPRDREARMRLARLLRDAGDAAGAREEWRAAVKLKEDAESLAALADAARASKDSKTELEAIERLSARDPSASEWRRVAEIRLAAQDWPGAEKAFRRALARDPRDAAANAGLGKVHLHKGEVQEAVEVLRASGEAGKEDLAALSKRLNLEKVSRADVGQLQKVVQGLVDRTYRSRLADAPSLTGVVKVRVTVAAAGAATLVEVLEDSVHDPDVRACAYWNLRDAGYPTNKPGRYSFTFAFRR